MSLISRLTGGGFDAGFDSDFIVPQNAYNFPFIDTRDAGDHYIVNVDVPGFNRDDLHIEVDQNRVTISGERYAESRDDSGYNERRFGRFSRTFSLGSTVSLTTSTAEYQDGVLTLHLPKSGTSIQ